MPRETLFDSRLLLIENLKKNRNLRKEVIAQFGDRYEDKVAIASYNRGNNRTFEYGIVNLKDLPQKMVELLDINNSLVNQRMFKEYLSKGMCFPDRALNFVVVSYVEEQGFASVANLHLSYLDFKESTEDRKKWKPEEVGDRRTFVQRLGLFFRGLGYLFEKF